MSDLLIAFILGIVEGITEFLPISSTGHLILAQYALGFTDDRADIFALFIQTGAVLAVVILYFRRFVGLIPRELPTPDRLRRALNPAAPEDAHFTGWRGLILLGLTVVPAALLGFLAGDAIKERLFNPISVAIGLGVGGLAILLIERQPPAARTDSLDGLTLQQALLIGLFQCLALWPGVSRAAATILGGMIMGLRRDTAAEYSFLAAVPALGGAGLYDLLRNLDVLTPADAPMFAVGFLVSLIAAGLAIRWLLRVISTGTFRPFGWYRLALAVVVFIVMSGLVG